DLVALPKAHLHVHLESTIRPATLAALGSAPLLPAAFAGFGAFAEYNAAVRSRLRTAADFERVAYEFCVDAAVDGVRYAELTFTAAAHGARLGDASLPLNGVLAGLSAGMRDTGLVVRLVLDHSRRRPLPAAETVRLALGHPDLVVAFGVAGDEAARLAPYAELVGSAAARGVHLVHHAGETGGAASVREALDLGRAERIGHGIRALEDRSLTAELRERQIPLEVCPSSNVALGLVPSLPEHPLPALVEAGLAVTLNTDIPSVTGRALSAEYAAVRDTFGCADTELVAFARTAVDAAYAPAPLKAELHRAITTWLAS
ncbi:MAG TPA: adenosine deaminase, partial [Mycobacteriales bacterium]|nr:adenosine deaminase [Mycobacteriales bacterium]